MIKLLRKKAATKTISMVTMFATILQILIPNLSYGLTGGPSQPEVESFTPVGTTDMVDLFTGDFNYNIPLLSVDGYPVNLAYTAGPTMDQEASWVGLGWNLNPGVINRNMRGVPDDFNGEQLEKKIYMKPNWTIGVTGSGKIKVIGLKTKPAKKLSATASVGLFFNNYKGFGLDLSLGGFQIENEKPAPKSPQDEITLGKIIKKQAMKSVVNMASDIFPEAQILSSIFNKDFRGTVKSIVSVSDNYSVRSFAYGTYTPEVNMEFNNQSYKLGVSFGGDAVGIFAAPAISGSFSLQSLAKENYNKSTFGYLYHGNKNSDDVILDINREKDGEFTVNRPVLPLPINTYDMFSISGQGVSGMIKPFRNGIDMYHDDVNQSNSYSGGANLELGVGTDLHTEIHINGQVSTSKSGKWSNDFSECLEYKSQDEKDDKFNENTYFRTIGERIPLNQQTIQNKNLNSIYNPVVKTNFLYIESPANLIKDNSLITPNTILFPFNFLNSPGVKINNSYPNSNNPNSDIYNKERVKRNQYVSYLTYNDITAFVQPEIENIRQKPTKLEKENVAVPNSVDALRKGHHLGEFSVVKNDGSRYIYGIAAYNNEQREVSFTTAGIGSKDLTKGIITYNTTDQQVLAEGNNKKGFDYKKSDEFYSSTKTKGFAHSYLLTSILSDDYLDVMPRGVGPEDLGNYTKFEYERLHDTYRWRTPYGATAAQYSEGLRSEVYDNKANFVEGTKEIWQLTCIKGKNQIAVFFKSERDDGIEAGKIEIVNGTPTTKIATKKSVKLDKIVLYDRMEYEKYDEPLKYAIPIKTINFEYNYSLCIGIENSSTTNNGKLTLTQIYTTIGISSKKFASYNFNYDAINTAHNPTYNMANINRWGGYKPRINDNPHNLEFPFVEQDQTKADMNTATWSLSKITLPSGGIIAVKYESDDYAYVQDKMAMQMTQIAGMGLSPNLITGSIGNSKIYTGIFPINNYLYFKLPTSTQGLTADEYVNETMKGIKNLAFKVMIKISTGKYEWINGYADIDFDNNATPFGLCTNPDNTISTNYYYIRLKQKNLESFTSGSSKISPITKAGFNFMKTNMPHAINPELADMITDNNDVKAEEVFYKLISLDGIIKKLEGVDKMLLNRGDCDEILSNEFSGIWGWARLNNAFKDKLGGGYRVKKITLNDNWTAMSGTGNIDQETGQEYDYTTEEDFRIGSNKIQRKISSGVAAFEPAVGSEENPFKLPIGFERKNRILPDEEDYIDGPVGESFYPAATVGYSKVTVTNLTRDNSPSSPLKKVKKHGVGKTVNEYYTAKDFPVIVNYTSVNIANINPPMIDLLFFSATLKKVAASQGFEIILNDMHGKAKAEYVYSESQTADEPNGKLISGSKYFYQTESNNPSKLKNEVKVINPDKTVEEKIIAVETETYADNRQKTDEFYSGAVELNWTTLITCFGLTFPTIIPTGEIKYDGFYSSTLLTVKNYYGIQNKTEVFQDGAYINSENLAYDAETGELLVSKTTNEYKEEQFNTVYPAHWNYNGMGQAYKNNGVNLIISGITTPRTVFTAPSNNYFEDNDEVLCEYYGSKFIGIIKLLPSTTPNQFKIYVQDKNTYSFLPYTTQNIVFSSGGHDLSIKVIRSGKRNMQSNPTLNVSSLINPIEGNTLLVLNNNKAILDAKATTYTNKKYEYKSFNDRCEISTVFTDIMPALNYMLTHQQVDFRDGIVNNVEYPSGSAIVARPITPNSEMLNSNNDFTNSFFHKINACNGCSDKNVLLSYQYARNDAGTSVDLRERGITFDIPICEINNNQKSNIRISFAFPYYNNNLDLDQFKHYKITGLALDATPNTSPTLVIDGCINRYVSTYSKIFLQKIDGSNNPNNLVLDGTFFIDITRCASTAYERLSLEDHLFRQNQLLATNPVNNWKPGASFVYKGERNYDVASIKSTNITALGNRSGIKGIYKTFSDFDFQNETNNAPKWKQSEETTLIDPYNGAELESKDALGRYRSVIYSPNTIQVNNQPPYILGNTGKPNPINPKDIETYATKPSVFTENARHCEVNVFNFESNNELQNRNPNLRKRVRSDRHYFNQEADCFLSGTAHTGKQSLQVKGNIGAEFFIAQNYTDPEVQNSILPYYPTAGKQLITGWVKVDKIFFGHIQNQPYCKIEILNELDNAVLNSTVLSKTIYPTGPIINGWQRFQGEFSIPQLSELEPGKKANILRVILNSGNSTQIAYFDDIRIHPIDANSKNYVYDEQQRISAILDENNYATFYYYDHKGELALIKRETDKGIVTVTETRKSSRTNP